MGPSCPPNLTHSTAYLTDKPYDVQLGVLRWIRGLLSEVIEEAASQLSTRATSIEPENIRQQDNLDHDAGCVGQETDSLPPDAETPMKNKHREHTQDKEGLSAVEGQDVDDCSSGGHGEAVRMFKTPAAGVTRATTDEDDSSVTTAVADDAAAADTADGDGGRMGVGRKRPRTPMLHERNTFGVGSVVECFHPVRDTLLLYGRIEPISGLSSVCGRSCVLRMRTGLRGNQAMW